MSVGLDTGRQNIKLVEVEKSSSGLKLTRYASEPVMIGKKTFDPESIGRGHLIAASQSLFRQQKRKPSRTKHLTTALTGNMVSVKQIRTVDMPENELASSLQLEARKHIPMDGTETVLDYQILGEDAKEIDKINVLLVACTRKVFSHHMEMLKEIGFKKSIVDAEPVGLINAYSMTNKMPDEGLLVLIDVGLVSSTLVVWGRGAMCFTRDIPMAGHHFTKWLSDSREIDYREAEALKKEEGTNLLNGSGAHTEGVGIAVAEHTIFDDFIEDVRRSLKYYIKTESQGSFNKILLTGGSAHMPGFAEYIGEKLNVNVEIFAPIQSLSYSGVEEIKDPGQYTIALGLAYRGLF